MKHLSYLLLAGVSAIGIAGSAYAADYNQAPEFAKMVEAGALPAVAERLGEEPLIMEPVDEVGKYGGLHTAGMVGGNDRNMLLKFTGYEPLFAWDRQWTGKIIPNIAKSYTASNDATTYTFELRAGMKWSDGNEFTAEDIAFFINDVVSNKKLYPSIPSWLLVDGKLPEVTVNSPTSITFKFSKPYGLFMKSVAGVFGTQLNMLSKNYCAQFLPKYNPKAEEIAAAAGATDWADHMINMCGVEIENIQRWRNAERPTLEAFLIVEPYVAGASQVTFHRNPYYWKVDPAGNQLPYLDGAAFTINADKQTALLAAIAGKTTFQQRHIATTANKPVLFDAKESGGIELVPRRVLTTADAAISINLTHEDPVKRAIFSNKDFRIALSHAIDRQAIIDTIYLGQAEAKQVSPTTDSAFGNKRLSTQYIEYDVDTANKMLDAVGLDKKDSNGMRLTAEGKPLVLNLMTVAALGSQADVSELVVQYWQAVGVDARLQTVDRTRFYEVKNNNDHDAVVWPGGGDGIEGYLDPRYLMPFSTESNYAVSWGKYYQGLDGGEEPPQAIKDQWELYEQLKSTADEDLQAKLWQQILEIAADQFYAIGVSSSPPGYAIKSKNLGNVEVNSPVSWLYPNPGPINSAQWYLKN